MMILVVMVMTMMTMLVLGCCETSLGNHRCRPHQYCHPDRFDSITSNAVTKLLKDAKGNFSTKGDINDDMGALGATNQR